MTEPRIVVSPRQSPGDQYTIPFTSREFVRVNKRLRSTDPKTVEDIAASIPHMGILEPILCTPADVKGFRTLIAGANRWEAMLRVWASHPGDEDRFTMPARTVHIDEDDMVAVEIAENLLRNDLTLKQREVMGARYGRMLVASSGSEASSGSDTSSSTKSKNPGGGRPKSKFTLWRESTGINVETAKRRWEACKTDGVVTGTPSEASDEQLDAFFVWVMARNEAEEQAKQAKSEEDAAKVKARELEAATSLWAKQLDAFLSQAQRAKAAGVLSVDRDVSDLYATLTA